MVYYLTRWFELLFRKLGLGCILDMLSASSRLLSAAFQRLDEEFPERPLFPTDPALLASAEAMVEAERPLSSAGYRCVPLWFSHSMEWCGLCCVMYLRILNRYTWPSEACWVCSVGTSGCIPSRVDAQSRASADSCRASVRAAPQTN